MRIALVGADVEENLGLGMVAAALVAARHRVEVVPCNDLDSLDAVIERVRASRPALVGLGMQFQHRARDFVLLARGLRASGFRGHLTAGGQYATLAGEELIQHEPTLDSVVLHEAETTIVELASAVERREAPTKVAGLVLRGSDGAPRRTAPRPLHEDLDRLPPAHRYRAPTRHLGVPFFPVWGSRGCWGSCAFCGITTYYRDARSHGAAGRKLRFRSPESLADEMARLAASAGGGPTIFCFHDETFLLPRPEDSLSRVRALRAALDERGVGFAGIVGKCRPECVTPELAIELRRLGVFRLYVGVENASQHGQDDLGRRTRTAELRGALAALRAAGIFGCYNLLVFEPDTTLDDVRENVAFMREHLQHPINFCRAEPYHKTPLYERVRARGTLGGSFLGWDYRLEDDRAELLYRITAAAFHERNFDPYGVANRYMGIGYMAQVLETFYDLSSPRGSRILARAAELVREVTLDTATHLELAIELAATASLTDRDRIERETALLGLRIAAHDRLWHAAFDDLIAEMSALVAAQRGELAERARGRARRGMVGGVALVGAVSIGASACGGDVKNDRQHSASEAGNAGADDGGIGASGGMLVDPLPMGGIGGFVSDMLPTGGVGGMVVDPLPVGGSGGMVADPVPDGGMGAFGGSDPVPVGGYGIGGGDPAGGSGGMVVDPLPMGGSIGGTVDLGGWVSDDVPTGGFGGVESDTVPNGGLGGIVDDPVPPAGGVGGFISDMAPSDGGMAGYWADPVPRNGGTAGMAGSAGTAGAAGSPPPVDPPPAPGGMSSRVDDASPASPRGGAGLTSTVAARLAVVDTWRSSAPRRSRRSEDLPFFAPPEIRLFAVRQGDAIEVTLRGVDEAMSIRWESEGEVEGSDRSVRWRPASEEDQLRVGVRTVGGVAVATLRARCVAT